MKPQLDIYNVVRSLVCMCLVKQFLSLSLSPFLWSLWCVTVVNRVSESRSRVDSVVCFRLVAGCRRESIPALRVPPLFLFPCSSIPAPLSLSLLPLASLPPSTRPVSLLPTSTCSPLLVSLDALSRLSFQYPLSFFHCSLATRICLPFGPCCSIFLISDALSRVRVSSTFSLSIRVFF